MFFINFAVLMFFTGYLVVNGEFQWTKVLYLLMVLFIGAVLYLLRIIFIGNNTVLDQFSASPYFGRGLIGFASVAMGVLITTLLILKTRWSIFINDFERLYFDPTKWFEFLNNNYQQIVLYTTIIITISGMLVAVVFLLSKYLPKRAEEALVKVATLVGIFIIFVLFNSQKLLNIWYSIFEIKIIQQTITYLFSGSLLYFNLFFLFKKPPA